MNTLGEKRVKVDFNVDSNESVDVIKRKTAQLINICEEERGDKNVNNISGEKQRLLSLAQTAFEEAAMWAVKAIHTK